ncbi:hypothetical protein LAZ67_8000727 [Cordylochernes scorpioides]|uniref:Gag protein n=1 Tax=Cordylochernes scorpioides TaxID=51811 RepID=A0ABY6KRK7_9ARAC|nr:hypothetical protein LAZ67_8000727 [Cordylochernes scorpioides]
MSLHKVPGSHFNWAPRWVNHSITKLYPRSLILLRIYLENPPGEESERQKWKLKDSQAKGIITCAITDSQVSLILTCKISKQIWASLTKRYEGDIKKKSIEVQNNVSRLRMYPEESWKDYLHRSEILLENARIMGATIDDEEFIYSVIKGLPQKYNIISMQINTMNNPTLSDIKSQFSLYQERNKRCCLFENQRGAELLTSNEQDSIDYSIIKIDGPAEEETNSSSGDEESSVEIQNPASNTRYNFRHTHRPGFYYEPGLSEEECEENSIIQAPNDTLLMTQYQNHIPKTYKEAIECLQASKWTEAMKK